VLGELFASVLGVPSVGIHDNFFELGGHSLLATQLLARVRARFDVPIQLRDAFQTPTVAGLAALIDELLAREAARLEAELGEEISQLSDEEVERRLRELEEAEREGTE
jgi:acyl carrier protein